MKINSKHILFLIIFCVTIFIYGKYLFLYFSQDDFFHLKVTQTDGSLKAFLNLFSFKPLAERGGMTYFYRPIFREAIYNIYYKAFGLNALPFRITQFIVHFANIILTYLVLVRITKNKSIAFFGAFFVGLAAANIGILSYLAGGIQISGMLMFGLISILFYDRFLTGKKFLDKFLSFLFFLFAIASHEIAATIPLIHMALFISKKGFNVKTLMRAIKGNLLSLGVVILFLYLEVFVIGLPTSEQHYGINFSLFKLLNSYFWYFVWSLGIPEMLVDFVGPGIRLNPNLMKYWGDYFIVIFISFVLLIAFLLATLPKLYRSKLYLFFVFWFIAGITPVVILPFHRLYYYLGFVLPAVGGILGLTHYEIYKKNKVLSAFFICILSVLTLTSIKLADTNYWAISRARIAKSLIDDVKNEYPTLPEGASVYFTNDEGQPYFNDEWGNSSKQASIILSESNALQLVYQDMSLKVYYEDLVVPKEEMIYPIKAVIYR